MPMFPRAHAVPLTPPAAVEPARPASVTPRERRLERALRLARRMIVQQEQADHATIDVIDNALRAGD